MSSYLPPEIVQGILTGIGEDRKTLLKAGAICKDWLVQQRAACFSKLQFHDEEDVRAFLLLISSPECTFPPTIAHKGVSFRNLSDNGGLIKAVARRISPPYSLSIGTSSGKIPRSVAKAMKRRAWRGSVHELRVVGGTHNPRTLFPIFSFFPHLNKLELEDFKFKAIRTWWWRQNRTYAFPPTLKTLSIVGDASPFQFLLERVIPSGGFDNIDALAIEVYFSDDEPGAQDMIRALKGLNTVSALKLKPSYDPTDLSRLEYDMWKFFGVRAPAPTSLTFRGFTHLEIDFSAVPAKYALNCLAACVMRLLGRKRAVSVDIRLPRSLDLWGGEDPAAQLEELLDPVSNTSTTPQQSTILLRDYPAQPPQGALSMGGFPITFLDAGA